MATSLLFRSSSTSDNLDKFARDDGLASSVEQNLELGDHIASVLGSILHDVSFDMDKDIRQNTYVHGVSSSGLLAGVAFGKCLIQS
jgi:hypothetical protein